MPMLNPPQSNTCGIIVIRKEADVLTKRSPDLENANTPICTESIGQSSTSLEHTRITESAAPEIRDGSIDSPELSPAPLRLPSDKVPNSGTLCSQNSTSLSSGHKFPLPPRSMTCSPNQTSRPLSPFPPPYSPLALSANSTNELVKNSNGLTKVSEHIVRRTQSAADIQKATESKPLPTKPSMLTKRKEQGEVKRWNKNIFKLPPISTSISVKGAKDIRRASPEVDSNSDKGSPPAIIDLTMRASPPASSTVAKEQTRGQEKEPSSPSKESRADTGEDDGKSNTPRLSPGPERESCGGRQKLTTEQVIWLHRNYRGEATFLKAWGLHITREADRERGYEILTELMAAESPKQEERQKGVRQQGRQLEQHGKLQYITRSSPEPRERESLHMINEEVISHELHRSSPRRSRGYVVGDSRHQ